MKYHRTMGVLPPVRSLAGTQEIMSLEACQGHNSVGLERGSYLDVQT